MTTDTYRPDEGGTAALALSGSVVAHRDLAERINAAHREVEQAMRDAVARAVAVGELLLEAKAAVGHGGWEAWIEANCTCSVRTAQTYMRVARKLAELPPEKAQRVADLSLREAIADLADDRRKVARLPEAVAATALEPPTKLRRRERQPEPKAEQSHDVVMARVLDRIHAWIACGLDIR